MAEVMLNGTEIATDDVRQHLMTQPEGSAMHRLLNLGPCPPNEPTNERLLRIVLASQGMSEVYRVPRSLDGKREDDLQHCARLAMTCHEIMKTPGYDHLDQAKVLSMALNHEWPEALAGDVPTYAISSDAYAHKKPSKRWRLTSWHSCSLKAPVVISWTTKKATRPKPALSAQSTN